MAAGLVSHNITTASGVTFAVVSWVPDTAAPDVGAVPIARITDGVNTAALTRYGLPPTAAYEGAPVLAVRADGVTAVPHANGMYSYLTTDVNGKLWISSIPAGAAHIGEVSLDPAQLSAPGQTSGAGSASVVLANDYGVPLETNKMQAGTLAVTPKFAPIQISATGTIIPAVTSKRIRVLAAMLTANGAVNVKWTSGGSDATGLSYLAAAGDGQVLPFNPVGWFESGTGQALVLNLSASVAVGGHTTYIEV